MFVAKNTAIPQHSISIETNIGNNNYTVVFRH